MKKKDMIELLVKSGRKRDEIVNLGTQQIRALAKEEMCGKESIKSLQDVVPQQNEEDTILDIGVSQENIPEQPDNTDDQSLKTNIPFDIKMQEPTPQPSSSSPSWTKYVLSQFQDDELEGENPRVEGLRRVADKLLNGILEEGCDLITSPSSDNGFRACAKAWVVFGNGQRFESLADASPENCSQDFCMYPVAMADTRAKGRVYRAALMLKKVIAAEEKCGEIMLLNNQQHIHSAQITAIRLLSDGLKLNPMDIAKEFCKKDFKDIKSLSYTEAQEVLKELNKRRNEE